MMSKLKCLCKTIYKKKKGFNDYLNQSFLFKKRIVGSILTRMAQCTPNQ